VTHATTQLLTLGTVIPMIIIPTPITTYCESPMAYDNTEVDSKLTNKSLEQQYGKSVTVSATTYESYHYNTE